MKNITDTVKKNDGCLPSIKGYCKDCVYFNKHGLCERFAQDPSTYKKSDIFWLCGNATLMFSTQELGYCDKFK